MNFRPEHFQVALEEARQVVKAMPPAEVPHILKGTRGSSSRRMTPVEARALYRVLDKDRRLRQATLDSWSPPPVAEADPHTAASVLFLERSEHWESTARSYLTEVALDEARVEIGRLREREKEMQGRVASLKAQKDQARQEAREELRDRTERLTRDLTRARERIAKLESDLAEQSRQTEFWEEQANAAFDDLDLVDRRYDDLRDRYRTKKPSAVPSEVTNTGRTGFSRDPMETARMLDQMVSFWEVGTDSPTPTPTLGTPLQLPLGIDPRSAGAVRWLYDDAARAFLLVDGWNVAYHWQYRQGESEPPDHRTVELVTNKLAKLARYSIGNHRVSFYLDSRQVNGIDPEWENRFQSGHLTGYYVNDADDAIAEETNRRSGEAVVVITSDKELADRCREHGAIVLASEGLAEWMARSPV